MPQKLTASVGRKGKNQPEDVKLVQNMLNPFAAEVGFPKLKVDGQPSPKLDKAISMFQENVCCFKADGRVDPGKKTIKKLGEGVSKAKNEKKAEEKKQEKIKQDEKVKLLKTVKAEAEKKAKEKSMPSSVFGSFWKELEKQTNELYDSWIATSEKKGETPEKAAPKISDMLNKETKKKIDKTIKEIDTGETVKPGRLAGKTSGVNQKLLNVLLEVSSFYGETINVVSGLRDKKGQASAMYNGWNSHLKQGKIYFYLRANEKLRLELDGFVQAKDKSGFTNCMMKKADWKQVSRHLSGDAADVSTKTNPKIIKALGTVLKYVPERNSEGIKCHHFDNRKLVFPISDAVKAKWTK